MEKHSRQSQLLLEPAAQVCRSRGAMPRQAREDTAKLERAAAPTASSRSAKRADTEMLVDRHIPEEPAPIGDQTHPAAHKCGAALAAAGLVADFHDYALCGSMEFEV